MIDSLSTNSLFSSLDKKYSGIKDHVSLPFFIFLKFQMLTYEEVWFFFSISFEHLKLNTFYSEKDTFKMMGFSQVYKKIFLIFKETSSINHLYRF